MIRRPPRSTQSRRRQRQMCIRDRDTLKRVLKAFKISWRRLRRVKAKQPPADEYARKRSALTILKDLDAVGEIALYYLDETGFTLMPPIPYAWQSVGQALGIPSQKSKRLNVLGFMHRRHGLESYVSKQSITSDVVATCLETFFSCLLYTSPSPRDLSTSRMPSSA